MTEKTDKKSQEIVELTKNQEIPDIAAMLPFFDCDNLPNKKRKILAVSILPHCIDWTIPQKAQLAGVSERYYWHCLADSEFRQLSVDTAKRLLGNHVFDVLNSFISTAEAGNVTAQQAILRQLNVLDKDNGNGSGASVTVNIAIVQQEREERMGKSLERFGYEVAAEPEDGN